MADVSSHSCNISSTSFKATAKMLNAAAVAMRDPLGVSPELYLTPREQVVALCESLLNGDEAELDARELAYLKRVRECADKLEVPCPSETQTGSTNAAVAGSGFSTTASESASERKTAQKHAPSQPTTSSQRIQPTRTRT